MTHYGFKAQLKHYSKHFQVEVAELVREMEKKRQREGDSPKDYFDDQSLITFFSKKIFSTVHF